MSTERPESWYGVDCDGTLAEYDGYSGPGHIGPVIPRMKERVLQWIKDGITVKIFTARASIEGQAKMIQDWLEENGMPRLDVTNVKDMGMVEFYDDRCTKVIFNTGLIFEEKNLEVLQKEIHEERNRCALDRARREADKRWLGMPPTPPPASPYTTGKPATPASMKRKAEKEEEEKAYWSGDPPPGTSVVSLEELRQRKLKQKQERIQALVDEAKKEPPF